MKDRKLSKSSVQYYRRLVRVFITLATIGLPFLKINSESALRFDITSLKLYFFGKVIWLEDFFIIIIAFLFIVFAFIFLTILLGRFWCGWLCPQTIVIENTLFMDRAQRRKTSKVKRFVAYTLVLIVSFIIGANFIWYFISPYEFFPELLTLNLNPVTTAVWTTFSLKVFVIFAFMRRRFCSDVCPYAKLQDVLFDNRTLVVAFAHERGGECLKDAQCIRACPLKIDIRKGVNAVCINCARCIDACANMMTGKQQRPLISYRFGLDGAGSGKGGVLSLIKRANVIAMLCISASFLVFFIYMISAKAPIELSIKANQSFKPYESKEVIISSYILRFKNMTGRPTGIEIEVSGIEGIKFINKPEIYVEGGQTESFVSYISTPKKDLSGKMITFSASFNSFKLYKNMSFVMP